MLRGLNISGITVIALPQNQGKFEAIKAGMNAASGVARLFTDVDVPYELEALPCVYNIIRHRGAHVVVGNRNLPGTEYAEKLELVR